MEYLITGGAGFIGSNYTHRLLERGERVTVYDNLARSGTKANLEWLREVHGPCSFRLIEADVRDYDSLVSAARGVDVIVHLAAQVAVTTSIVDPRDDFMCNALGTFNLLEAARHAESRPLVLYASTNKVYGEMRGVETVEHDARYGYSDLRFGIPETQSLDFHSPYGCSKGSADQYVLDYARIYGTRTVVLRQSCIYGPRQFGLEDQGWVAWFMIAALLGKPITIYGDGKQVRDILFIDDLLDSYDAAIASIELASGQAYNIGGGPGQTMSVWAEFGPIIEGLLDRPLPVSYAGWRSGDQRVYISDIRKAARDLGWAPRVELEDGISRLYAWVSANRTLFV